MRVIEFGNRQGRRSIASAIVLCAAAVCAVTAGGQSTSPPFRGTVYLNPNVFTDADPTAFTGLTYGGLGTRKMFDRRIAKFANTRAFLFDANYQDGLEIEVQVNVEFGSREIAERHARKYAHYIGKLPTLLREDVETVWIHKGDESFGGGNRNILIHVDRAEKRENGSFRPGGRGNYLEETFVHEATHTSLDDLHEKAAGWLAAGQADGTFISTYARDRPDREDLAESFLPYLLVRYRSDRMPSDLVEKIRRTIPHRIAYLDRNLKGRWCPVVPEDCESE